MKVIINKEIDRFVKAVNLSKREPILDTELYTMLRVGLPNDEGLCDWNIRSYNSEERISEIEKRIGFKLPESYRSLVTRYIFPSFQIGNILLHGNTPNSSDEFEFAVRLFLDKNLSNVLIQNGFIQFARPSETNYDPICFSLQKTNTEHEVAIVQLDHEAILQKDEIIGTKILSKSFIDLIKKARQL